MSQWASSLVQWDRRCMNGGMNTILNNHVPIRPLTTQWIIDGKQSTRAYCKILILWPLKLNADHTRGRRYIVDPSFLWKGTPGWVEYRNRKWLSRFMRVFGKNVIHTISEDLKFLEKRIFLQTSPVKFWSRNLSISLSIAEKRLSILLPVDSIRLA